MIDSIQNKYHREIIKKLIIQNPSKESFFLDEYTKLKKYKALIKNKNIKFDSFFEKEISFKSFEDFSDKISNEIILNNAKKMKRSILNNKYKHLENERTNKLFLTLAENNIKKEAIKDFIGKKIITYINKSPEEFNNALSDVVETLISWDINKYKKNKILNKSDILEESEQTLLVDMNTTKKVNQYGSDMWCIKRDENYYQEYKSEGLRFFNFLDFNKNADDKKSQIAFAVNFQGDIIDAYFKNDDNAMSYVKKELPNYKFKSMNIEEIIDYLDETNTINKETFVKKFIEQSNELIIDNIYIDIEDMPTEDYTIDQLFEYGYDTWEYEGFGRDNIIKLTSFINTENNNSNEIIDMLFKNNMPEKDEFFTNCIYKKLRNDKSFNGKELIKLAEEYSEKSSIDLSEILFNVEFFALESEFKREILSELKTQNKCGNEFETRDILNNSPLEDTEIIIDYLSNNPLWSINKQDYINNILKTEDREKVKGLNHLINSNEINSLKPEVIIKAFKIADNIYENEINKSIKEKIISKIKENKQDYISFFKESKKYINDVKERSKEVFYNDSNKSLDFNQVYEIAQIFKIDELNNILKEKLNSSTFYINDSKYMNDFLENINDDKIRAEYFKTLIKSEFSIFTNKDEFVKYNKIVEKKLLKENISVLDNVLDNIDNYHSGDKWKRNLIVSKITGELKNREKQNLVLSNKKSPKI